MKKLSVAAVILLLSLPVFNLNIAECKTRPRVDWAILIAGTNTVMNLWGVASGRTEEPLYDCYYMFHVLKDHGVPRDHILFLHIAPESVRSAYVPYDDIDGKCASRDDVRSAIDWLKARCTSTDNALIFIASHGGGYWADEGEITRGGGIDYDGDEDGDGVDESIGFHYFMNHSSTYKAYYDDDFKSDLEGLSYNKLTIVLMSCFSGGFIDDLSASNRIIITSSSETKPTEPASEEGKFTPFIGAFIDALHGYHAVWNKDDVNNRIVDTYEITVSDYDCNSVISWREAFVYAKDGFPDDSPWFDSNGNRLPTYKNGQNYLEHFLWIWHNWGGYTTPNTGGYEYPHGTIVEVKAVPLNNQYEFDHWLPDDLTYWEIAYHVFPKSNPYYQTMNKDHMLKAYFIYKSSGGGGGGGDGCPTLYTCNGKSYVDYGVIDIHNPTGEDMVKKVSISKQDLAVEDGKAELRLQEGWLGLNYSESVIDQVKLYAIDEDGKLKPCSLTTAVHSRLGNVRKYLALSDDVKAQTLLLETIDLTFKVREDSQGFVFVIEGCNQLKN